MSVSAINVCHNHHLSPVILQKKKKRKRNNNLDHGFKKQKTNKSTLQSLQADHDSI